MKRASLAPIVLALAGLAGCGGGGTSPTPPAPAKLTGDLDVDIRSSAHVELVVTNGDLTATITLTGNGFDLAPAPDKLQGTGHVELFPEADATLYTARFDAPAATGGPCAGQPATLWLSLHRQGKNAHVGGSLTGYCGSGTRHGVPARLLRLAGDLPL